MTTAGLRPRECCAMEEYTYYLVENTFVARIAKGTTERLMPDGTWVDYADRWDVFTNGRRLEDEAHAMEKAAWLVERNRRREKKRRANSGDAEV